MNNKKNLLFFEANSMKELYNEMEKWQSDNEKRLLSISIEKGNDVYECIALSNPTEVVLTDEFGNTIKYNNPLAVKGY